MKNLILFIFGISIILKLILSKTFIYDPFFWLFIASGTAIIQQSNVLGSKKENTGGVRT